MTRSPSGAPTANSFSGTDPRNHPIPPCKPRIRPACLCGLCHGSKPLTREAKRTHALIALEQACNEALGKSGIKPASLIIGGGPLALAARALADRMPVRLIEPVPAAIRRIGLMVHNRAG